MFFDPRARRVFIHRDPVDLRRGHNGLSEIVTHTKRRDLLSGDLFLFVSRDLAFTHASGHSALDAFSRWWLYGTLISIGLGLDATRAREKAAAALAAPVKSESVQAIRARRGPRPLGLPVR